MNFSRKCVGLVLLKAVVDQTLLHEQVQKLLPRRFQTRVICHHDVRFATFVGQTPLTRFAASKFSRVPALPFSDTREADRIGRIDENDDVTQFSPTRFQQNGRIENDGIPIFLDGRCNSFGDSPADLGMHDLLQFAPGGYLNRGVTEYFGRQKRPDDLAIGSKDFPSESFAELFFYRLR